MEDPGSKRNVPCLFCLLSHLLCSKYLVTAWPISGRCGWSTKVRTTSKRCQSPTPSRLQPTCLPKRGMRLERSNAYVVAKAWCLRTIVAPFCTLASTSGYRQLVAMLDPAHHARGICEDLQESAKRIKPMVPQSRVFELIETQLWSHLKGLQVNSKIKSRP
jgi:hypothetical protein